MSTIARTRRMARYTRRSIRRSLQREAAIETALSEWRCKANEPMTSLALSLMSLALGTFLAALIVTALIG